MTLPHDRQVAAWLADDAPEAPPDSLARALAATRRTRKRPRWTFPDRWLPMHPTTFAKLGVTVVAVAAVGLVGLTVVRGPAIGPAASLSPATFTERFDSSLHGLSISYPAGWQVRPATQLWNDRFVPDFDSPTADVIFDRSLGDRLYLILTSSRGMAGSVDDWHGFKAWPVLCASSDGEESGARHVPNAVDGAQGYLFTSSCSNGGPTRYGAEFAMPDRGYLIYLYVGNESLRGTYDEAWFAALVDTLDLRPDEAHDAP